jgi:hypothetical protein
MTPQRVVGFSGWLAVDNFAFWHIASFRGGAEFWSLPGHSGHGRTCYRRDQVANDPNQKRNQTNLYLFAFGAIFGS